MTDGEAMLRLARTRIGEKYVNVQVPKNNPNWHGPWDCAEFMSWLVYQVSSQGGPGILYGCIDDMAPPAVADAYTGAWQRDAAKRGITISVDEAVRTTGAMLLRFPPTPGAMGHIVLSDGRGGTVEAKSRRYGVVADTTQGRAWNIGVKIPGMTYSAANPQTPAATPPALLYAVGRPGMKASVIKNIQRALKAVGISPGPIDGVYGDNTAAAVAAFQTVKGLVTDGQVGATTAKWLKIDLA